MPENARAAAVKTEPKVEKKTGEDRTPEVRLHPANLQAQFLHLQRTVGNRAIANLPKSGQLGGFHFQSMPKTMNPAVSQTVQFKAEEGEKLQTKTVIQRQGDKTRPETSSSAEQEGPGGTNQETIALPAGHEVRMARLGALKKDIEGYRTTCCDSRKKLEGLPKVCTGENNEYAIADQEQAEVLTGEILSSEVYLVSLLLDEINLINETLSAINSVLPGQSGPGIPEVPQEIWDEVSRLEADKKKAEQGYHQLRVSARLSAAGKSKAAKQDLDECEPPKGPFKHPSKVSDTLIRRLMGQVKGDPGEGCREKPYIASKGETVCTIGYGHQLQNCPIVEEDGKLECACWNDHITYDCKGPHAEAELRKDADGWAADHVHKVVPVDLGQEEFDALVDITLHHGSIPSGLLETIKLYWCTSAGKNYARDVYLNSSLTAQNSKKIEPGFVERRKRRVWPVSREDTCCTLDVQ